MHLDESTLIYSVHTRLYEKILKVGTHLPEVRAASGIQSIRTSCLPRFDRVDKTERAKVFT